MKENRKDYLKILIHCNFLRNRKVLTYKSKTNYVSIINELNTEQC